MILRSKSDIGNVAEMSAGLGHCRRKLPTFSQIGHYQLSSHLHPNESFGFEHLNLGVHSSPCHPRHKEQRYWTMPTHFG